MACEGTFFCGWIEEPSPWGAWVAVAGAGSTGSGRDCAAPASAGPPRSCAVVRNNPLGVSNIPSAGEKRAKGPIVSDAHFCRNGDLDYAAASSSSPKG